MTLCEQLKSIVEDYFERYPHMSINGLALKSGVAPTTLRRIVNASTKGELASHTALNLASAVTNEKRLSVLVGLFDGPLGETLREVFGPYVEREMPHQCSTDLNLELKDSIKYFIYKAAANRKGVSLTWVADTFGKLGLVRLEEMQKKNLVQIVEDQIKATVSHFSLELEIAAQHLPELVKFYKPEELEKGRNLFYNLSESLSEEGVRKIKEIKREAIKKVYDVMSDSKYAGEISYFALFLADTLAFEESSEEVLQ